ncbi:formimidoylglutamate deiminase [Tabrizicola fusiformis]|uniref:formimidoylglutamate deiminase n=1 Tax=Tabrizicola sp. SY72 TaxID=2741673 RepID=UPI0015724F28|nr:formimidoylglutamate deiminase [Tabrizicola sp. SY72]NTT85769.1 formimidoylglutamate deiminase [Tabrizicola sp. SY72]
MTVIHAKTALLPEGWAQDVTVRLEAGRITSVQPGAAAEGQRVDCLLPAMVNLHSHAFQRAMAGLTEYRSAGQDSFWTWRTLMYRFLDRLTPEDVQAIAAMVMLEMAEAGYAAVAEFHYLHHAPGGQTYDDLAEMSGRIAAAAAETGLGLTHLPVLYERGGCDGRALTAGQLRFGNDPDRFARLWQGAAAALRGLPEDTVLGVAPHSLRAASPLGLRLASGLCPRTPVHIHVAEQVAEVAEVQAATGLRPVEWLLKNVELGPRWCLIHATQMEPFETEGMARAGAVAGLCPITESNLGDGIFDSMRFRAAGGVFGVGSDSNVRISLSEELRTLEYSQRLAGKGRAMLADAGRSTGRVLYEEAAKGGAVAGGRASGAIAPGLWADLLALDCSGPDMAFAAGDTLLDTFLFAGDDRMVAEVWSAGRHIVTGGRHAGREAIRARYRGAMARLRGAL